MTGNGKASTAVFESLLREMPVWVRTLGSVPHVILSSRVRYARNLNSVPFPTQATVRQQATVLTRVRRMAGSVDGLQDANFVELQDLGEGDLEFLVERRLVSRDLVRGKRRRGVLIAPGEGFSIMVNEEDHLRLQSVVPGLGLGEALDAMNGIETELDSRLEFAFDEQLGFLTACPTNVGTGMRASVLAHLPALVLTRRAKKVVQGVTAMGLAVRGAYGEGTEITGNFFQISNQTTLGPNENEIVSRLDEVVRQIIGFEDEARATMWRTARVQLEDKIYRAWGTLTQARSITVEEVVSLSSAIRFGIALEMSGLCSLPVLNEILIVSQPGHLARAAGRELEAEERRQIRADSIRKRLEESAKETSNGDRGIAPEPPTPSED